MLEKIGRCSVAGVACWLLLAAGAHAQSGTVTAGSYSATSTSEDIAESCARLSVSAEGELKADCNAADANGDVSAGETSLTLTDHLGCLKESFGTYSVYGMGWGSGDPDFVLEKWSVATTVTGGGYTVSAECRRGAFEMYAATSVSLSDTTSGLKNDAGELEKR